MDKKILWVVFVVYISIITKVILYKNYIGAVKYANYHGVLSVRQNFQRINYVPFRSILDLLKEGLNIFVIQNILGNILLFVPLGILLPVLRPTTASFFKIFLFSLMLSAAFEFIQLIGVLGICDVDDIILNTTGGIIGFIVYKLFLLIFHEPNFNIRQKSV